MRVYVTNEEPSADCNKCRNDCDFFFGRRRSNWCLWHILSRAIIKGVLLFYPAQYVQKSDVGLYMICQKRRHLLDPAAANAHTAQREDQPARCTHKNKLHVYHKAAIKSLTSHSEKVIAKLSQHFPIRNCRFYVKLSTELSQNFRKIIAPISQLETADFCEIFDGIIARVPYISCSIAA